MQTFDQALLGHVLEGNIDEEIAFEVASSPHDFKLMLEAQGPARRAGSSRCCEGARTEAERPRPACSADGRPASFPEALAILGCASWELHRTDPAVPAAAGHERTLPVPSVRCAEIISGKWTLLVIRDLADAQPTLLRARALARGDQPADALAAPAGARGVRHRRAPHLPRGAAAGRVRADREGPRAGAADRGHALLRPALAGETPPPSGGSRREPRLTRLAVACNARLQCRSVPWPGEASRHA